MKPPVCRALLVLALMTLPAPAQDNNTRTGPAIGRRIPRFTAPDQHGKPRSFEDLRGPKGLVLLFYRSADW